MSLELAYDLWDELKHYLTGSDIPDAANSVVHMLVDHDYSISDISSVFRGDTDIKAALSSYADELTDNDDNEEKDYYYENYDDEEYDNDRDY